MGPVAQADLCRTVAHSGAQWRMYSPGGRATTLGLYRVKNEDRWITMSLERTLEVADEVILLDDHSTDMTREIASGFKSVTVVRSPFSGVDEARDRIIFFRSQSPDDRGGSYSWTETRS